jgi:hypothetical protein
MSSSADYCDLCELPRSQCVHGQPPPVEAKPPARTPKPRKTAPRTKTAAPAKPVTRRWTPPEALKPFVIEVLRDAGHELDADELFSALEILVKDRLTPGDLEKTPEGELRWWYAARRARQALIGEGVMAQGRPGIWALTDA